MLMNRIMGALTFKREVYAEVEKDKSFTGTAWAIVAVIALVTQLGTGLAVYSVNGDLTGMLLTAVLGTAFAVGGFALGAVVIAWVGKALFKADVTFEELVRTLGLAYVWGAVGAIGALASFVPVLGCVVAPLACIAAIAALVASFFAVQQALGLGTAETLVTVIIGWIATAAVVFVGGAILGMLGFATSGGLQDMINSFNSQ
ncbi:MAG: YIP1 family protein [Anaerolineales bacterium]